MSQPLVVKIHAFGEDIATIYYRWSAYTWPSLAIAEELVRKLDWKTCLTKDEVIFRLLSYTERTGGGLDSSDWKYFEAVYPDKEYKVEGVSASDGLVGISEFTMNGQQEYACGEMTIDYDEQEIYNSCYQYYECLDDYIASYGNDLDMPEGGFEHIDIDPSHFRFEQLDDVRKELTGGEFFLFGEELFGIEEGIKLITMYRGKWKFSVMSADEAEEFIKQPHYERIQFISITEADGEHIDFKNAKGNITFLPLKFDDCTTDADGACISEIQADNVVKFILDNHEADKTTWFCVNCYAGVSRSAAVCAAIMRILCNDDAPVFTNAAFCPNMTVYRKVLNAWIDRLSNDGENTSQEIWNSVNPSLIGE